jgi:hypothetical protein
MVEKRGAYLPSAARIVGLGRGGWYPWSGSEPGMPSGAKPSGRAEVDYGRTVSPCCYLGARWTLVWATSPNRCVPLAAQVCLRHSAGKNPRPNHKPKKSVAWKKEKKQVPVVILHWIFTSNTKEETGRYVRPVCSSLGCVQYLFSFSLGGEVFGGQQLVLDIGLHQPEHHWTEIWY